MNYMPESPLINVTMPVFNRFYATQQAIAAFRLHTRGAPVVLTVVDNGSEERLASRLRDMKKDGLIDHLYRLPRNMGISCACNVGWQLVRAPYYMKLDNDIAVRKKGFFQILFRAWEHGERFSTLGATDNRQLLQKNAGWFETPEGVILGICDTNLAGAAILIPQRVSDTLGMWSEDYGLYGAEDGDYGVRMNNIGFRQYYYYGPDFLTYLDHEDLENTYDEYGLDKTAEHRSLFFEEATKRVGLFKVNHYLFTMCIRSLKVPLKYEIKNVKDDYEVTLGISKSYLPVHEALLLCQKKISHCLGMGRNGDMLYRDVFLREMKRIMADCGQAPQER